MGFESYHPAINLIYFLAVTLLSLLLRQPVFLALSWVCAFAYSVRRNGLRALIFDLAMIPCVLLFAAFYGSYHHFGVTQLWTNFIGNRVTLESFVYGAVLAACVAAWAMWMSCVHSVFTADNIVFLLGRVSPRLSLFVAVLLRTVPRVKAQARRIACARSGIGRGTRQGNALRRLRNAFAVASMTLTWLLESLATTSDSMRSRGYGRRGRTAFSVYRFDNRDRAIVVVLFAFLTLILMGILLQQTSVSFDPRITINPITPLSCTFYAAYFLFCLLPLGLELYSDMTFYMTRRRHEALPSVHA